MSKTAIDSLNSPVAIFLDWTLALAALAYGTYLILLGETNWIAYTTLVGGLFGCVFAYLRPANLIKNNLRKKLLKR